MRFLLVLLILLTMVGRAEGLAKPWDRTPRGLPAFEQEIGETSPTAEEVVNVVFSEIEKRIIERYFGKDEDETEGKNDDKGVTLKGKGKSKGLPPGLAKRANLPPGLARHVQLHGSLPPGLQKRNLPDDLLAQLPKLPVGYERVIIDEDVVLIEKATGLILDVIEDVLSNNGEGVNANRASGSTDAS